MSENKVLYKKKGLVGKCHTISLTSECPALWVLKVLHAFAEQVLGFIKESMCTAFELKVHMFKSYA